MEKRLGEIVDRGRTSDLHQWGEGQVVKLYHDWFKPEWVQKEAQ